jgi:hypothetical protein
LLSGNNLLATSDYGTGVGESNATMGSTVNSSFIPTPLDTAGIQQSGNTLHVSSSESGTVGIYNATTGAPINGSFIVTATTQNIFLAGKVHHRPLA